MHIIGWEFAIVAAALFVGAVLQGVIGFGMVVLAYPVLIMVEPSLIPQTTLVSAFPPVLLMAWRTRGSSDWGEVAWFNVGRMPGYVGAIVVLGLFSKRDLTIVGGVSVLAAVGLSLWAPTIHRTRQNLAAGGLASALLGTSIGIGGPPIGLLYQDESGDRLRSTVSLQMLLGSPVSLLVLVLAGRLSRPDLLTGAALVPFTVGGNYASALVIPYFNDRLRPLILATCGLAASFALARVLL